MAESIKNSTSTESTFRRHLTTAMRRRGIRPVQMARQLGISEAALSNKRRGMRNFSLQEAEEAAKTLGVSLDVLVDAPPLARGKRDFYSIPQVMRLMGASRDFVVSLIQHGNLTAIQPDRKYFITRRSYEKLLAGSEQ